MGLSMLQRPGRFRRHLAALAIPIALLAAPLSAQDVTGDWYGVLDVGAMKLRIHLEVSDSGSGYEARLGSPDQGPGMMTLDAFSLEDGSVRFSASGPGLEYEGEANPAFTTITGTFRQSGQSFPLNLARELPEAPRGSPEWLAERLNKTEVYVTMRDGTRLFTSYYVPKDTTRSYPILLTRTPYNIEPGGEDSFSRYLGINAGLVEAGYIFAFQDVRGRYMSEGEFGDVRPYDPDKSGTEFDEASDTWDTIDWLVNHVPRNNGAVGVFGVSYPGFYSTM